MPTTLEDAFREIAELRALVKSQAALIAQQAALIAELREKLGTNSKNSSKPPSSDPPSVSLVPPKKKSGKKRGGQHGHRRNSRELLPVEQVDHVVPVVPDQCDCGHVLKGRDPEPLRHQVFELPPIRPIVTEYQLHALNCPVCRRRVRASLPDGVSRCGVGPNVDATVGLLTGMCRLSKRTTSEVMNGLFHVPLCVGAVVDSQNRVSEALAAPVEELRVHAQQQSIKHADETSWKEMSKRVYLWAVVTPLIAVFSIAGRSSDVAKVVLGRVVGILCTDRYSGYAWWPVAMRQVCWAHLQRDFIKILERGGQSFTVGLALLEESERMFAWWGRVKDGDLKRKTFEVYMRTLRKRLRSHLEDGTQVDHLKTARTCKQMLKVFEAFFTFVANEGVEPTNNMAEQAVRFAVLWRKMSYGTQSARGSRFVERVVSTYVTLRKQKRNVVEFLRQACSAHRRREAPPSLLPS